MTEDQVDIVDGYKAHQRWRSGLTGCDPTVFTVRTRLAQPNVEAAYEEMKGYGSYQDSAVLGSHAVGLSDVCASCVLYGNKTRPKG